MLKWTSAGVVFLLFVAATLLITRWAAGRSRSQRDLYAAGGDLGSLKNGMAIAGDAVSAAGFLGLTASFYQYGFDTLFIVIAPFFWGALLLFLIVDRFRNLGQYTFIDVAAFRLDQRRMKLICSASGLVVVVCYLAAQMVGAGKLVELLFGIDYTVALLCISVLVVIYIAFGGMLAATWIQLIKAGLLLAGAALLAIAVLTRFDFDFDALVHAATDAHPRATDILGPGLWLHDPVSVISTALSVTLGWLGLPHLLMRLFTVKNARDARESTLYATLLQGGFYLLIIVIGFGAVALVTNDVTSRGPDGTIIGGQNMIALHLTRVVLGEAAMGFMAAVAFSTILAVVAGLIVAGATIISHDVYNLWFSSQAATPASEIRVFRCATLALGVLAVLLGLVFEHQNIIFIAIIALSVAASVNFPILMLSMYSRSVTSAGMLAGGVAGLASTLLLILLGPHVMVPILGYQRALVPYEYPTLFSMALTFVVTLLVSRLDRSETARTERAAFAAQRMTSEFGTPATGACEADRT